MRFNSYYGRYICGIETLIPLLVKAIQYYGRYIHEIIKMLAYQLIKTNHCNISFTL